MASGRVNRLAKPVIGPFLSIALSVISLLCCSGHAIFSQPCLAQAERAYSIPGNRVLSIDESPDKSSLTLRLQGQKAPARPIFNYMSGEGGDTVLTADFVGLAWNSPARIIRLISSEKAFRSGDFGGIKEVRVSQFVDSPAVLRISFVARDPRALKSVAIAAASGLLKISWPAVQSSPLASSSSSSSSSSLAAPVVAPRGAQSDTAVLPPVAPSAQSSRMSAAAMAFRASQSAAAAQKTTAANSLSDISASTNTDSPNASRLSRPNQAPAQTSTPMSSAAQAFRSSQMSSSGTSSSQADASPTASNSSSYPQNASASVPPSAFEKTLKLPRPGQKLTASDTAGGVASMLAAARDAAGSAGGDPSNGLLSNSSTDSADVGPPPTISLVPCDNLGSGAQLEVFRVEMPSDREISFKAFRMHNPERYVIDIPNCTSIAKAELPDVKSSALVSSIRVGVPNENDSAVGESKNTGRLVLQLTDNQVNVASHFTPGSNYLSVTLGKGLMLGTEGGQTGGQTSEKFSTSEIAPGPIYVPRAPSETVIVLDAGHGGSDAGAVRSDIQEKDITLGIIEKLKKILEAKGARIVLTRHDDTFVSLEDRVKITNQVGPNLFLSVHINSLEGTSNIYGIETYFQTELSRPLAERVHASLVAGLGTPDRNIRRARFYVINHTPVPAILAEVGYITNKAERDKLISSDYQQKVASALARGVMLYLQDNGISAGRLANSAKDGHAQ